MGMAAIQFGYVQALAIDPEGNLIVGCYALKGACRTFVFIYRRCCIPTGLGFEYTLHGRFNVTANTPNNYLLLRSPPGCPLGLLLVSDKVARLGTSICDQPLLGMDEAE